MKRWQLLNQLYHQQGNQVYNRVRKPAHCAMLSRLHIRPEIQIDNTVGEGVNQVVSPLRRAITGAGL